MAASLAASSPRLPEIVFLRTCPGPRLLRIPAVRFYSPSRRCRSTFRNFIKAESTENPTAVVEVLEEAEDGTKGPSGYNWNGNGSSYGYNGSLEGSNGSLKGVLNGNGASNGSLMKYVNGNGARVNAADEVSTEKSEKKQKKTVEEIGQEEA